MGRLFQDTDLVTLTGAPGVGKSALAAAVGAVGAGEDGGAVVVVAVDLLEAWDAPALTAALGGTPEAGRGLLVLLDNCDRLLPAVADVAEELLADRPGLRILATSREPLRARGETVWRVPALSVPDPGDDDLPGVYLRSAAVQLFYERAAAVRPGMIPGPDTAPAVAEVCRRLDGLPLAIELAAAQVASLSPAELAARLDERLDLLSGGIRTAHPRHHRLRASLEWSWETLPAGLRSMLGRLSAFAGSFSAEAAVAVGAGGPVGEKELVAALASLAARSLVEADHDAGRTRFRLLESIRRFAAEKLVAAGEADAVDARHRAYHVAMVAAAGDPRQGASWFEGLAPEAADVAASLERAIAAGDAEAALRLAPAHALACRAGERHVDARDALERALAVAPEGPPALRAQALCDAGRLALVVGDRKTALERLRASAAAWQATGERAAAARTLALAGFVSVADDPDAGLRTLAEAVAMASGAGDEACLADTLAASGRGHLLVGNVSLARTEFLRSLTLARAADDEIGIANGLVGLGWAALVRGDLALADSALGEGAAAARAVGEVHTHAVALAWQGELARVRDDAARAHDRFGESAALARSVGTPYPLARALIGLGRVADAAEERAVAADHFATALALSRRHDLVQLFAPCLRGLAGLAAGEGRAAHAESLLEEGLASARRCGDRAEEARLHEELARLAREGGHRIRATLLQHKALALFDQVEDRAGTIDALEALGGLAAEGGRLGWAARLFGAAEAARAELGLKRPPGGQGGFEADLARVREGLDAQELDEERRHGARLTLGQAVAQASRGRRARGHSLSAPPVLTPAEREVVELVQQRLTNAEIAERLTLSRRTVESHLQRAYAKLGIHSRRDLWNRERG